MAVPVRRVEYGPAGMEVGAAHPGADRAHEVADAVQALAGRGGEDALWANIAQLRAVFDALPAALVLLDREGRYRAIGGKRIAPSNSRPASRIGDSVFVTRRDRPDILADVRRALAGEEVRTTREIDGGVWETQYAPLRDSAGTVIGVVYIALDITARALAEAALREREARLRTQYQAFPLPSFTWQRVNGQFIFVDFNAAADAFSPGVLAARLGQSAAAIYRDAPGIVAHLERCHRERATVQGELRFRSAVRNGEFDLILTSVFMPPDLVVMHAEDITERKRAEAALRASEASLAAAQRIAHLSSWEYDFARSAMHWSDEAFRIAGYPPQAFEPTVERFYALIHPEDRELVRAEFRAALKRKAPIALDYRIVRPDGEIRVIHQQAELARDAEGRPLKWFGSGQDVTERRALETRLAYQAFHDPLTGLPNRALFLDRLTQAVARASRQPSHCAVLFLDLDRFKDVNDTLGHAAGDRLLTAVAGRLRTILREGDTLARLGGDEFAVLLEDVADIDEATRVARRLSRVLEPPVALDGAECNARASIGIVLGGSAGETPEDLLRDADVAMYRAKEAGRGQYAIFDPAMQAQLIERLALELDLLQAMAREEFVLRYQPIVDLRTGQLAKVEALLRWQHPTRGLVSPEVFVPLAEESGLIRQLGRWVLAESARQARAWRAPSGDGPGVVVSVNLSAREFLDPDLAAEVARVLRECDLPPEYLELEITETVLMEDAAVTLGTLRGLKRLGVQLAVDDFGTGYSSLAYLKRFPVDVLKIDRSFVSGHVADPDDTAIVSAIITLAHTLGLRVTAEGVETEAQARQFAQLGCALAQGFHFSRPLTAAEVGDLLRTRATLTTPLPSSPRREQTAELRRRSALRARRLLLPVAVRGPE